MAANKTRKPGRTPDTEPELLAQWQREYRALTEEQGMKPYSSYQTIADRYNVARSTVAMHLNPDLRRRQNEGKKKHSGYQNTDENRAQQAAGMFLRHNFDLFVISAFHGTSEALTLDQVAGLLYDLLEEVDRPGVLMKPQTCLRHSARYDPPLLEEVVGDAKPPLYQLAAHYRMPN